jgi:hypothetical protein
VLRDHQGYRKPRGIGGGFSGVGVRVWIFGPLQNPYPQEGYEGYEGKILEQWFLKLGLKNVNIITQCE